MSTISYAITVCNETTEISNLLELIHATIRPEDEVVVLVDEPKAPEMLRTVLIGMQDRFKPDQFKLYFSAFKNNFAEWKNELNSHCTKEYIFNIDADEYAPTSFMRQLPALLDSNPTVDLFYVPRSNIVHGLNEEHIKKWHWRVDGHNLVNWPDYQMRIYKNKSSIFWAGKVHEKVVGHETESFFPDDRMSDYKLIHIKDIEKQESQNSFYESL